MSPKTFKSVSIFALMGSLSQSQWVFWMGFQFNALNKVFYYHRLEVFTCFVLQHKIHHQMSYNWILRLWLLTCGWMSLQKVSRTLNVIMPNKGTLTFSLVHLARRWFNIRIQNALSYSNSLLEWTNQILVVERAFDLCLAVSKGLIDCSPLPPHG